MDNIFHLDPALRHDNRRVSPNIRGVASPLRRVLMPEIARRLCIDNETRNTIIGKIRLFNSKYGFPDPLNPRIWCGDLKTGSDAIVWKSVFDRDEIESWFDHHRSPSQPTAQMIQRPARREATAATLSHRGQELVARMAR